MTVSLVPNSGAAGLLATNLGIPSGQSGIPNLLNVAWPPGVADGIYSFIIAATLPGAFADGTVGVSDVLAAGVDSVTSSE